MEIHVIEVGQKRLLVACNTKASHNNKKDINTRIPWKFDLSSLKCFIKNIPASYFDSRLINLSMNAHPLMSSNLDFISSILFLFLFVFFFVCLHHIMALSNDRTSCPLLGPSIATFVHKKRACLYGGLALHQNFWGT